MPRNSSDISAESQLQIDSRVGVEGPALTYDAGRRKALAKEQACRLEPLEEPLKDWTSKGL